jgi:hypothetical protein
MRSSITLTKRSAGPLCDGMRVPLLPWSFAVRLTFTRLEGRSTGQLELQLSLSHTLSDACIDRILDSGCIMPRKSTTVTFRFIDAIWWRDRVKSR